MNEPMLEKIEATIWGFKDGAGKFPTQITLGRTFFEDVFWPSDEVQNRVKYTTEAMKADPLKCAALLIAPPGVNDFRVVLDDTHPRSSWGHLA